MLEGYIANSKRRIRGDTGRQGPPEPDTEPAEEPGPSEFLQDDAVRLRGGCV